jgi:hypothetical protein
MATVKSKPPESPIDDGLEEARAKIEEDREWRRLTTPVFADLPEGTAGVPYSASLAGEDDRVMLQAGPLPPGLRLEDELLVGRPCFDDGTSTAGGPWEFTVHIQPGARAGRRHHTPGVTMGDSGSSGTPPPEGGTAYVIGFRFTCKRGSAL